MGNTVDDKPQLDTHVSASGGDCGSEELITEASVSPTPGLTPGPVVPSPLPSTDEDPAGAAVAAAAAAADAAVGATVVTPALPLTLAYGPGDVGLRLVVRVTPHLTCLGMVASFSVASRWHAIAYDDGRKDMKWG